MRNGRGAGEGDSREVEISRLATTAPWEVVSHGLGPELSRRRGVGLSFLEMAPELRERVGALYEAALHEAAGDPK